MLSACCSSDANDTKAEEASDESTENNRWTEIKKSGEIVVGTSGTLILASFYDGDEERED